MIPRGKLRMTRAGWLAALMLFICTSAFTQPPPTSLDLVFGPVPATAIQIVITAVAGDTQPCIDELELYGPHSQENLALATTGALASASSCLPGYAAHAVDHLNDGQYGNAQSWISNEPGAGWVMIEFPAETIVDRCVLSRDRQGAFTDRRITALELHYRDHLGAWHKLLDQQLAIIDLNTIPTPPRLRAKNSERAATPDALAEAFLLEEYANLMAQGRADFHPAVSAPRYNMDRPGPRHVGDDHLPLPRLPYAPTLDGSLTDDAWQFASAGVARVADPEGAVAALQATMVPGARESQSSPAAPFPHRNPRSALRASSVSPLIEQTVHAGTHGDALYLAIQTPQRLSSWVALVSSGDWTGGGAILFTDGALRFQPFFSTDKQVIPVDGAANAQGTAFECRLPLDTFRTWQHTGIRVGLGLGGKYTAKFGRPVTFTPAPLAIANQGYRNGSFNVRITDPSGNSQILQEVGERGPLGPEKTLEIEGFTLHLLQYAPATGCIRHAFELCDRLAAKGIDTVAARQTLLDLQAQNDAWLLDNNADPQAQRSLYLNARRLKRDLFLSDPDLTPAQRILFVKRQPFRPSHNYSVILDAPWNPGGAVCILDLPRNDTRLNPEAATLTTIFDAGEGLARTPMADFECHNVYFAYKPAKDGYFHLYRAAMANGAVDQLTDGPFHDYWPTPLPDGGLAFISTRCHRRFLCWRPQAATLHRMDANGENIRILSHANLTEWAPSIMDDGRIIWTRSEYQDKAADFGHTLWAIRPDGTHPELVFGNTITKTNGYANGRFIPGTNKVACTLISHFGDLNGPIAILDTGQGRFNTDAISSITPEVFWPGSPLDSECFRDPVPLSKDLILCSHAADKRFDLYAIDRYGNRELLYADPEISSMCPTVFQPRPRPPVLEPLPPADTDTGEFLIADVYQGLEPTVTRGQAAWIAISVEVEHTLDQLENGAYRDDHDPFQQFYASPTDVLSGPNGWPTYAAKERLGIVPIAPDGSACFRAPAGRVLYFHVLDADYNELQRMRSVLQLQPGERRSCIGCHENRQATTVRTATPAALATPPHDIQPDPWGAGPFSYERIVQPVLDIHCIRCHDGTRKDGLNFTAAQDENKIPASYRTLITTGLVHYADWTWSNPDVCHELPPKSLGTLKSKLFQVLQAGHHDLALPTDALRALKTWVDLNCPLWPDYTERKHRPTPVPPPDWIQHLASTAPPTPR